MKWLCLVNGSETSAAGERARAFAVRLPATWQTQILYRPARKWKGIVPFIAAARRIRPDLVYVMDTAYTGVLAARVIQRQVGCRWITDTGDAAYELAKSSGSYSAGQLALIGAVEKTALRRSDGIVVRGSAHRELLLAQNVKRVAFVPDGVECAALEAASSEAARNAFRHANGLENQLVVGLVGSMSWSSRYSMCYGWDIVESLAHLDDCPISALLIGDGDGKSRLEARAKELNVAERIVWTGRMRYNDLPPAITAMDVCVSTQSNDIVGQVRTTGKLPLYLACGRFVAATDVGEARRVLPGIGALLPYEGVRDDGYPARLAQLVRTRAASPEPEDVSKKAREVARKEFDYDMLAQRMAQFCLETVDAARGPRSAAPKETTPPQFSPGRETERL